jgi:hypothetical protein
MKIWMLLLMFFAIAALIIISNHDLALYKEENRQTFSELYTDWLGDIYSNGLKLTGHIVKLDWLPKDKG